MDDAVLFALEFPFPIAIPVEQVELIKPSKQVRSQGCAAGGSKAKDPAASSGSGSWPVGAPAADLQSFSRKRESRAAGAKGGLPVGGGVSQL